MGIRPNGELTRHLWSVVIPYESDECLDWPFRKDRHGYGRLRFEGREQSVTRVICEIVHGPAPSTSHHAAHSCGKGHLGCVNKRHLSWKTRAENEADKLLHGTSNRGSRCGSAKLSEVQALEILALKGTMRQQDIAELYGVKRGTVSHIHKGTTWGWLTA